jgi:RHS repeat-associated protein
MNTTTKINLVTGSMAQSKDAKGYYQNFNYDAFGSLLSVTDSASPSHTLFTATYGYGLDAFQTASTDPDSGARSYTIDPLGEVTAYSDAKAQGFSLTHDALSRPLVRTEPDLTTTWTWGNSAASYNIGQLQSVSSVGTAGNYSEAYTYDSKTRVASKTISIPSDASYTYTYTYDPMTGLPATMSYPVSTSSYKLQLQYGYQHGFLASITDANSGVVYWLANATNARGQVTQETLGNGVVTNRSFDPVAGWVSSIQAGVGTGSALLNLSFGYDLMANVTQRQNNNAGLTENFYYDADYRLDHSTLGGTVNLQMAYDTTGMGNISSRSDVASGAAWTYDPVRIHAVTQAGSSTYTYSYDANGNATSRNGYSVAWTSYNYPSGINSSGESVTFQYGPDRQRWQTIYTGSIGTETTYRVGKTLEKVINGGTTDYRHYIFAGSELVAIYSRMSSGTNTVRYAIGDHQSSFATILNSTGTTDVNESFSAYGNRRSGETWSGPPSAQDETAINGVSRNGYTGESVLGVSMGLNHLNGRVQDAITGRFLSPDPYIPDPTNTQSFNRYSYASNNPITRSDVTGFDDQDGVLDEIVVVGNAIHDAGVNFLTWLSSIFDGGGGAHPSSGQLKIQAAGLANAENLQSVPYYSELNGSRIPLDSIPTTPPQVTAASAAAAAAAAPPQPLGSSTPANPPNPPSPSAPSAPSTAVATANNIDPSEALQEIVPSAQRLPVELGPSDLGTSSSPAGTTGPTATEAGIVPSAIAGGRAFQGAFHSFFNVPPNSVKTVTSIGNVISDLNLPSVATGEIKAGKYIYRSAQIRAQLQAALSGARVIPHYLIVSPASKVSGPLLEGIAETGAQVLVFDAEEGTIVTYTGEAVSEEFFEFLELLAIGIEE